MGGGGWVDEVASQVDNALALVSVERAAAAGRHGRRGRVRLGLNGWRSAWMPAVAVMLALAALLCPATPAAR